MDVLDATCMNIDAVDATLEALRAQATVSWQDYRGSGFWRVLGYHDARRVLTDPAMSSHNGTGPWSRWDGLERPPYRSLNQSDGAEHRALRTAVAAGFPGGGDLAERFADALGARRPGDDLVGPIDAIVFGAFADQLGVPVDWRPRLRQVALRIARSEDPEHREPVEPETAWRAGEAEVAGFLDALLARPAPVGSLLAHTASLGLSEVDARFLARLFVQTGFETTTAAVVSAFVARCAQPDADVDADEYLRWASPVVRIGRLATTDVTLGGQAIRRGERVVAMLRAANRDPSVFPRPDRLERRAVPHLAFGAGAHHCLGAAIARGHVAAFLGVFTPGFAVVRAEPLLSSFLCAYKRVIVDRR